eukprot:scaffold62094_cov63-Phaeocystis_antarctica.AAC.2
MQFLPAFLARNSSGLLLRFPERGRRCALKNKVKRKEILRRSTPLLRYPPNSRLWDTNTGEFLGDSCTLSCTLTLALTTSRPPTNHACLHRAGDKLIWVLFPVEFFDLCRLEESNGTAAATVLALAALPPVLADAAAAALLTDAAPPPVLAKAAAAALLAGAALPPVLADAAAAALLADTAPPPVLAKTAAAAVLALVALPSVLAEAAAAALLADTAHPPVLADASAAALLAGAALPSVLADATATALLAVAAIPPVLAEAAAATVLAAVALPPVFADATAAAVLAPAALPPVLALLLSHLHVRRARTAGPTFLHNSRARRRDARVQMFQHSASVGPCDFVTSGNRIVHVARPLVVS